jgi:hypothetical protein
VANVGQDGAKVQAKVRLCVQVAGKGLEALQSVDNSGIIGLGSSLGTLARSRSGDLRGKNNNVNNTADTKISLLIPEMPNARSEGPTVWARQSHVTIREPQSYYRWQCPNLVVPTTG